MNFVKQLPNKIVQGKEDAYEEMNKFYNDLSVMEKMG